MTSDVEHMLGMTLAPVPVQPGFALLSQNGTRESDRDQDLASHTRGDKET